jgi:hypothetical protein
LIGGVLKDGRRIGKFLYTPLSCELAAKAGVENLRLDGLFNGCLKRIIYMPLTLLRALPKMPLFRFWQHVVQLPVE